jgi:hypothetical protein
VCAPAAFCPANQDPSTITDFDGFVGLAYINGIVTETNVKTGVSRRLPFQTSDMRFMQGFYRNGKGRVRVGTFAWSEWRCMTPVWGHHRSRSRSRRQNAISILFSAAVSVLPRRVD